MRRSGRVSAAVPWLYLKGISTGDLQAALTVLVGDQAKGLSAHVVSRLQADWARRELCEQRYVYGWADGVHTGVRAADDPRLCLLVIIGVRCDGRKERVALADGCRAAKPSWRDVLRDLQARGLSEGPRLAIGDGALGFWAALDEVYAATRHQRCGFHKMGNVLSRLPKALQSQAKAALQAIRMAPTRREAEQAFDRCVRSYHAQYPQATEKWIKDRAALLGFYSMTFRRSTASTCGRPTRSSPRSRRSATAPRAPGTAGRARRSSG